MSAWPPSGFAIEAMKAEIDGGAVEGRMALSNLPAGGGSRFDAELKGERLDLDAAAALTRSLAGPPGDWPEEAQLSLDIGRAMSAGQELRPFMAKLGYGPKMFSLDRLKIGQPDSVTVEGSGNFDRASLTGKLALEFDRGVAAPSSPRLIAPFAPSLVVAAQCVGNRSGARAHQAGARSRQEQDTGRSSRRVAPSLDLDAPQLKGSATLTAMPELSALRGIDLDALKRSEFSLESKLSSDQGRILAGAARTRSRGRRRRRPGAIRGIGGGHVAFAVAAESEDDGRRA